MIRFVAHGLIAAVVCVGSASLAGAGELGPGRGDRAVECDAAPVLEGSPSDRGNSRHRRHRGCGHDNWWYPPGGVYYYDPFWPYYYRPGYFRNYTHIYFGPWHVPGKVFYGPQPVRPFMGVAPGAAIDPLPEEIPAPAPKSNQRAIELGRRFIEFGDAHFRDRRFAEAYRRYKKAAEAAPGLAEAYFRQGIALVAVGNYHLAADVLKKGLRHDPDWPRSAFQLDDLYGDNPAEKTAHAEALAQAADENQQNGNLLFLLGVYLHFDGQQDRALLFFERAQQLGPDRWHLTGFLQQLHQAAL